jgi:deoxyribodipyrimidine photo-lyase
MTDARPRIFWFRRDLRLRDNPGLGAAATESAPVIPIFVLDPETEAQGAAPLWRLGLGVERLAADLAARGSRLILRRGRAEDVLPDLAREIGASAVHWGRAYLPDLVRRDEAVSAALSAQGISSTAHEGFLLHEPWALETKAGGPFRVYSPFWRAAAARPVPEPVPVPRLLAPSRWPASDRLAAWTLDRRMNRGAAVVGQHVAVGEGAAWDRLDAFLDGPVDTYATNRNRPDVYRTSRLSENLTYGEISVRAVWHAAREAGEAGARGAETFLKELVWRDFAWHLVWHTPHILHDNWRPGWDAFPWRGENADFERWRRGLTGEPIVDAGMREMWVTGRMHNRVRMLVASYLCKHLLTHWKPGADVFADCLIDWDPASNALGWQWVSGSGPDAAPYFRVFNPATQADKFDPDGAYRARFLQGPNAAAFFEAVPRRWRLNPDDPAPPSLVDLKAGRERALAAYKAHVDAEG